MTANTDSPSATDATPANRAGTAPRRALHVVFNANASGASGPGDRERLAAALRRYGGDVEVTLTESIEELAGVWGEDDGRRIVLVGGDGTVHAAARLEGPARDVALIPGGSANNIARSLGIPVELEGAAKLAVEGEVRPIDLIEASWEGGSRLILESVSVGFLAQARVRYRGRNSSDMFAGLRAGAGALKRFHPFAVRVHTSSGTEELHLAQLFVANLPLYEFGLRIAPDADASDSTLDVIGIEAENRRSVLRMVADLRRGTHLDHLKVHSWRAPSLTLSTNGTSPIVGDSADLGEGPLELRAIPAALRLVRP